MKQEVNNSELYTLPKDLAERFYERGHRLFKEGTGSAVELERVAKELLKAISFCPDQFKHYVLFGNVYKKASDLSSAIFSYRYAYRLDDTSVALKKLLAQSLSQQGQEILYLAQMSLQQQMKLRKRPGSKGALSRCNSSVNSPTNSRPTTSGTSRPVTPGHEKDEKKTPTEVAFSKDKDGYDVSLFSKALGRFNESLKLENNDYKVWVYKTMCHVRLNENLDALQAVSRAIATSRVNNVEFYILRAKLYWARGLTDDGNRDIRAACTMDPEHPEIKQYIARSYAKAESLYRLGLLAFSEGDYKKALFNLQHALSVSTDDVKLYIMISKIHRMMGNLQEAYSFIQQAATIFNTGCNSTLALPEDIRVQTNLIFNDLALKYIESGEYNKAIVLYNKVIADEINHGMGAKEPDYRYYVNRGDCYRALTQYQAAIEDYTKGLSLQSGDWDIKTRLSLTYYLEGLDVFNRFNDYATAERLLTGAIKHNPKVAEYYTIRGRTRYYTGDYPGSYKDYTMSLELNPDNPTVRETLKQFNSKQLEEEERKKEAKTKPTLASSSSNQNMLKCTAGGINYEPVPTSDVDMVQSLLDFKMAKKLPDIVQQRKHTVAVVSKKQPTAASILPSVNPNMVPALLVREEALKSRKKLKKFLTDKVDTCSKGPLFSMFDAASALARSKGISRKRAEESKKGYAITAVSAVALKKLSQERSREAQKNGSVILSDTRKDAANIKEVADRMEARASRLRDQQAREKAAVDAAMNDELDSDDDSESEHLSRSSHSIMARSRTSDTYGKSEEEDDGSLYEDDSTYSASSQSSRKHGASSMGINLSASDLASAGENKRYHLKALDEWARDAKMVGKVKGKRLKRRAVDKKLKSVNVEGGVDVADDSDSDVEENVPSEFYADGSAFAATDVGTTAWNVSDALKDEALLESTLMLTEEEEVAMIAQLKADKEAAAIEHRKKELARLRGEIVVGDGGGDMENEEGVDEERDTLNALNNSDADGKGPAAAGAAVKSFYTKSSNSVQNVTSVDAIASSDEEKPTRHQSMISVDNFGVHDINDC